MTFIVLALLQYQPPPLATDIHGMQGHTLARWLVAFSCILLAGTPAHGAERKRVTVIDKPQLSLMPSSTAPEILGAPVLSGLDYTAVAPPGTRLRVIEDEPHIYLLGNSCHGKEKTRQGSSSITLKGTEPGGGTYTALINLRYIPGKKSCNPLRLSFDTAAYYAYTHTMLATEERDSAVYAVSELRTPLGLTDPDSSENRHREYLAYSAAVLSPALWTLAETDASFTPYTFVRGQLKVLRRTSDAHCLLTLDIEAVDFAHSLTLTENLARCIINRLDPKMKLKQRLPYLAYYPEYEPFVPYFDGEMPPAGTPDLAEQPGEGCGQDALPITGDVCPACSSQVGWPARPYADSGYSYQLGVDGQPPRCSHCLLSPGMDSYDAVNQLRLLVSCGNESYDDCRPGCPKRASSCTNWESHCQPCRPGECHCRAKCDGCAESPQEPTVSTVPASNTVDEKPWQS